MSMPSDFYDLIVRETIKSGLRGDLGVWDVIGSIFDADANTDYNEDSLTQKAACVAAEATSNQDHPNWEVVMMDALEELL